MGDKIRFFAAYKIDKKELLFSECPDITKFQLYSKDFERISIVLKNTNISISDFQKIHTSNGTWFCLLDEFKISYMLLTIPIYPVSSALRLLKNIQSEIQKFPDYSNLNQEYLSKQLGLFALNSMKEFELNSNAQDTLKSAQDQVLQTQIVVQKSITDMISNSEKAKEIEGKSEDMGSIADSFRCTAARIRKEMWRRKVRNYLVISVICIVFVILLYFGFKSD